MLGEGLTLFDLLFALIMLSLFGALLTGIIVVLRRLGRHESRLRLGQCPRCGTEVERRPYVRPGERPEDSRYAAWFCKQCSRVVHVGPKL